jgi:hypothetical protein
MNAVPSGLSRRFATKLKDHSFSTLAEEPKDGKEPKGEGAKRNRRMPGTQLFVVSPTDTADKNNNYECPYNRHPSHR